MICKIAYSVFILGLAASIALPQDKAPEKKAAPAGGLLQPSMDPTGGRAFPQGRAENFPKVMTGHGH
jgi:hypothetical protein